MRFEWDEDKNRRNLAKHKVSFQTAKLVFEDPNVHIQVDRVVEGEERWKALGLIRGSWFCWRSTLIWRKKANRWYVSSQLERRRWRSEEFMTKLTKTQEKEIGDLRRMKAAEIDFTDIPLTTGWSRAVVGGFCRPVKKSLTIRLDADVLAWLKGQGKGYQTRINGMPRQAMRQSAPSRVHSK